MRTTWGKMGTNPSPVMKSIGLVTPRTLGRSGLFKLGPRILCKQGSIKMTPKVDLVSRTKLAKHPVELRKVSIFNTAKSGRCATSLANTEPQASRSLSWSSSQLTEKRLKDQNDLEASPVHQLPIPTVESWTTALRWDHSQGHQQPEKTTPTQPQYEQDSLGHGHHEGSEE